MGTPPTVIQPQMVSRLRLCGKTSKIPYCCVARHRHIGVHLFLGRLRLSFFRGRPAPLVAFGGFCRRASWRFAVCPFRLVFCPFSARFPFRRVFVRPSFFRAFLPRFRACFGRLSVCPLRRFHFNALFRPFTAFFRSARAIYQGNKKKPVLGAIFKAFSGSSVRAWCVRPFGAFARGENKKRVKPLSLTPWSVFFILLFLAIERNCARRLASSICNRASRHSLANYNQ